MSRLFYKARREAGTIKRGIAYAVRGWGLVNLYVYELAWAKAPGVKAPEVEVEIKRLSDTNESQLKAVADFRFYGHSGDALLAFLRAGQDCYVAEHQGQPVACYWRATGEYYDHVLKRCFRFTPEEEYLLGGYTVSAFRGKGIMPYLITVTSDERMRDNFNLRSICFVRASNKVSRRSVERIGFRITGRVGFVEALGIRFSFLVGRGVLQATMSMPVCS